MERDKTTLTKLVYKIYFNSHAHVERDSEVEETSSVMENFNSHAHVERDFELLVTKFCCAISTHTLTWSVTFLKNFIDDLLSFQLTRSRGA